MIHKDYHLFISSLLTGLMLLFFIQVTAADQELPLLGENASLNLQKEINLGRGLYQRLKQKGYVIDDPLLSRYLSDIGESLLSSLDVRLREYHFFLVKDSSVNAFAAPGGYIGVNIGLIALTRTEDELASVLAHEIAHVELMHSMQMIEKASDVNVAGVISILAAILVGSQDPAAGSAILYTGIAGSAQAMINFTRANEYEADRVGIELLKKSNYNPAAMASFMQLLQQREQSGAFSNIEYIRTHPISSNRVAEIRSRLLNLKKQVYKTRRYQQFKNYLFYLYAESVSLNKQNSFSKALDLTRNGQYRKAEKHYLELIETDPDSLWYSYALAENMEYQQRLEDAHQLYQSMMLLYPDELALGTRLVGVLLRQDQLEKALETTHRLAQQHENKVKIYQLMVEIYSRLGDEPLKQLAEANYHWFNGNKKQAKKLFNALLSGGQLDLPSEERVRVKLDKD